MVLERLSHKPLFGSTTLVMRPTVPKTIPLKFFYFNELHFIFCLAKEGMSEMTIGGTSTSVSVCVIMLYKYIYILFAVPYYAKILTYNATG